jgi:hypothetical protein
MERMLPTRLRPIVASTLLAFLFASCIHSSATWFPDAELRSPPFTQRLVVVGPGRLAVLQYRFVTGIPMPDAFHERLLFVELPPEELVAGRTIAFPSPGIRGVLVIGKGPEFETGEARGRVLIHTVDAHTVEAELEAQCTELDWEHSGSEEFERTDVPPWPAELSKP